MVSPCLDSQSMHSITLKSLISISIRSPSSSVPLTLIGTPRTIRDDRTTSPEGSSVTNLVLNLSQGLSSFSIIPNEIYEYIATKSSDTRTYTIEDRNLTCDHFITSFSFSLGQGKDSGKNHLVVPFLFLLELGTFSLPMTFLTTIIASLGVCTTLTRMFLLALRALRVFYITQPITSIVGLCSFIVVRLRM